MNETEAFYLAILNYLKKEHEAIVERIYKGNCSSYEDYRQSCRCVAYLEMIEEHCRKTYKRVFDESATH